LKLIEIFSLTDLNILNEVEVDSSWIEDVEMDGRDCIMTLLSGRQYRIKNFPETLHELWTEAGSPGKFWHKFVAGKYVVYRED
jgi:hypothetical protein